MPGPRGPLPPELPHSPRDAGTALPLPDRAASSSRCAPAAPPRGVPPTRARPPQGPPRPVRRHLARCLALPFITGPCAQAVACPTPEPLDRQLTPSTLVEQHCRGLPVTPPLPTKPRPSADPSWPCLSVHTPKVPRSHHQKDAGGGDTRSSQSPQISANSHHDYFSSAEGTAQVSIGRSSHSLGTAQHSTQEAQLELTTGKGVGEEGQGEPKEIHHGGGKNLRRNKS